MNRNSFGTLYIVATPIGNLQDITQRCIDTLKKVNWIAAEDTRHSAPLLTAFGIPTKTLTLHEHNERDNAQKVVEMLKKGDSVALISDAGTPLISDPGYHLVREARAAGADVVPIPGSCAAIAALSVAGLPTDRFVFEGFLPPKKTARVKRLAALETEFRTMVFYESPHRILDLLEDMRDIFGDERQVVIARELTKLFETIHLGNLSETLEWIIADTNQQRGEFVVVLEGRKEEICQTETELEHILKVLLAEFPLKQAVDVATKLTGLKKNDIYEQALALKKAL